MQERFPKGSFNRMNNDSTGFSRPGSAAEAKLTTRTKWVCLISWFHESGAVCLPTRQSSTRVHMVLPRDGAARALPGFIFKQHAPTDHNNFRVTKAFVYACSPREPMRRGSTSRRHLTIASQRGNVANSYASAACGTSSNQGPRGFQNRAKPTGRSWEAEFRYRACPCGHHHLGASPENSAVKACQGQGGGL